MKRIISFIALFLALITVICSCSGTSEDTTAASTEELTAAQTDPAETDFTVVDSSLCLKLYRGDSAADAEVKAAVKLKNALTEKYGGLYTGGINSDYIISNRENNTVDVEGPEILVGDTNRRESRETLASLGDEEWTVRVVGEKLVIIGKSSYATALAVDAFIENCITPSGSESLIISRELCLSGKREETRPPLADGASLRFMSWNLGCAVGVAADCITVLNSYLPDIISLQESNASIHTNVINAFIKEHNEYKTALSKHKGTSTYVYTPIIYNSNKMTLAEAGSEWLDGRYTGTNTKCICWAVFKTDEGTFAVINFHGAVCSNSYKGYENCSSAELNQIASAWRLDNVRQLLEVKKSICDKYGDIPLTINGDCNFNSSSEPFAKLISAGFADAETTADSKTNAGYKTSYSYGNEIPSKGLSIDHIFGINGVYFASFTIVRDAVVKTASDHTPVFADYNPFGKK